MYVIFAGGGKVSRFVALDLLEHGHEVAIIERVPHRVDDLLREHDLLVIEGDATDVRDLSQTKPERADVFVATTHDDDANFVACQLAITAFEVPRVIARVNKPQNEELFRRLKIEPISTTSLISRLIREQLTGGDLMHLATLRAGEVNLLEIDIPATVQRRMPKFSEMSLPTQTIVACVFRDDEMLPVHPDMRFRPGDQVIALARPEHEEDLRSAILRWTEA